MKRLSTACAIATLALAGCGGSGPPENQFTAVGDPTADPPRTRGASYRPGERIDIGLADATTSYPVNTWAGEVYMPGDLDHDGFGDLLIYGHSASPPDTVECSHGCPAFDRLFLDVVYGGPNLGQTQELTSSARINGWQVNSLQRLVRPAGDVDHDGRADFLVGIWTTGCEQGNAFLVYGGPRLAGENDVRERGAMLRESGHCTHFGPSTGLGDIDGDGFDDYAVGAPAAQGGGGRLFVYYGSATRPTARRSELDATSALFDPGGTTFGFADPVGDVNGDGADDFVVYAREHERETIQRAWLMLGGPRVAGEIDVSLRGIRIDAAVRSVTRAGDLDHDGIDDLALSAQTGEMHDAFVFRGHAHWDPVLTLDAATTRIRRDAPAQSRTFVVGAGDVNGDGHPDLLYGDPGYGLPADARGAAYLFLGGASGLAAEPALAQGTVFLGRNWLNATGTEAGAEELGRALASGSDLNGDGLTDLAFLGGSGESSRIYLWLGRR